MPHLEIALRLAASVKAGSITGSAPEAAAAYYALALHAALRLRALSTRRGAHCVVRLVRHITILADLAQGAGVRGLLARIALVAPLRPRLGTRTRWARIARPRATITSLVVSAFERSSLAGAAIFSVVATNVNGVGP